MDFALGLRCWCEALLDATNAASERTALLRMSWKDTLDFGVCGHARALPLGGLGLLQNNVAHDYQNISEEV